MSDQQLKLLERALAANDSEVIATWQVYKLRQADDYTGTNLLKALGAKSFLVGRSAPKPRVLCLSVRRSKSKGYKPLLSLFKPSSEAEAGFKASITCELHQVAELKLITPKASKQQQDQQQVVNGVTLKTLEVRILGDASSLTAPDDMVLRLGLVDEEQIMAVMAIAAQLLRLSNTKLPRLTGLLPEDLDVWWGSHQQQVLAALGKFAAEVLSTSVQADSGLGAATAVLMSAKEEKDLEELLDLHAMGLGDMAEFEARLQEEHDALEEANVQAVLAQVPLVDTVVLNMRKVQGMLEDLDANLVVLDAKLRHMRDDISAIESSNNSLELQARNNTK